MQQMRRLCCYEKKMTMQPTGYYLKTEKYRPRVWTRMVSDQRKIFLHAFMGKWLAKYCVIACISHMNSQSPGANTVVCVLLIC